MQAVARLVCRQAVARLVCRQAVADIHAVAEMRAIEGTQIKC